MNASAAIAPVEKWSLRASDFELLHRAGALDDISRAELIDGDIYGMSPQLARHAWVKTELAFALKSQLAAMGSDLRVFVEVSVVVADDSVPMPDVVVSGYNGARYIPADTVLLAVEVADSTLNRDLGRKATLYAAAGIPEYWVVDVNEQCVVTHWQPNTGGYAERDKAHFGEALASATIKGLVIETVPLTG